MKLTIYLGKSSDGVLIVGHEEELDWYKSYININGDGAHSVIDIIRVDGVDLYEEN